MQDAKKGRPDPGGGRDLEFGVEGIGRELQRALHHIAGFGRAEIGICGRRGLVDGVDLLKLGHAPRRQCGGIQRRLGVIVDGIDATKIDGQADRGGNRDHQKPEHHADGAGAVLVKAAHPDWDASNPLPPLNKWQHVHPRKLVHPHRIEPDRRFGGVKFAGEVKVKSKAGYGAHSGCNGLLRKCGAGI